VPIKYKSDLPLLDINYLKADEIYLASRVICLGVRVVGHHVRDRFSIWENGWCRQHCVPFGILPILCISKAAQKDVDILESRREWKINWIFYGTWT
jgi:hypothetical protein